MTLRIRRAEREDAGALFSLMRGLAVFERYIDDFGVTEELIVHLAFESDPPAFHALVAEADRGELVGMLVYYFIPFAFRGAPTFYMKELFVHEEWRGRGIGEQLLREAKRIASEAGCAIIKWHVARWNEDGARFYERLGGKADEVWVEYVLEVPTSPVV